MNWRIIILGMLYFNLGFSQINLLTDGKIHYVGSTNGYIHLNDGLVEVPELASLSYVIIEGFRLYSLNYKVRYQKTWNDDFIIKEREIKFYATQDEIDSLYEMINDYIKRAKFSLEKLKPMIVQLGDNILTIEHQTIPYSNSKILALFQTPEDVALEISPYKYSLDIQGVKIFQLFGKIRD